MNSIPIIIISFVAFFVGYRFYAKKIEDLWGINTKRSTPSFTKYDGVDFVPAKNWLVLFGHHFSSIAGAGPIVGPVIACCIWGWAPTLIWVIVGSIFLGGVHDFGTLITSVREDGKSISEVASSVISKRAKIVYAIFIWLALILVIAVFVYFCADTFVKEPKIIIPSLGLIPIAVLVGYLLYDRKLNQVLSTIIGLGLFLILIIIGQNVNSFNLSFTAWAIILLGYSYIASILPVNILLQPRDYLCSFLLFFGICAGFIGLLIMHPNMELPAFVAFKPEKAGMLWPMLFITVACGAISGFHSLIATGTSSKQIPNERYAKRIGYGGMITEGLLAVMVILVVSAGLGKQCLILIDTSTPVVIFGKGFGAVTNTILFGVGSSIAIIILNSFILTTLDSATRITRYITEELFRIKNRFISTGIIVILGGWLALAKDSASVPVWKKLWPAFGASNQLVAAMALFVISCWLFSKNKQTKFTIYPAIFMLITAMAALVVLTMQRYKAQDYLLTGISIVLMALAAFITVEVAQFFLKGKRA